MAKSQTYQFRGKSLRLGEVVKILHPTAEGSEYNTYYQRYYQRMKKGVSFEDAIADSHVAIVPRSRLQLEVETPAFQPEVAPAWLDPHDYAQEVFVNYKKYAGRTLAYVLQEEPSYVEWMRRRITEDNTPEHCVLLEHINELYDLFPDVEDECVAALRGYHDKKNKEGNQQSTTTLGDNPALRALLNQAAVDEAVVSGVSKPLVIFGHQDATRLKPAKATGTQVSTVLRPVVQLPQMDLPADYNSLTLEAAQKLYQEAQYEISELKHEMSTMDKRRPVITSRLAKLAEGAKALTERIEFIKSAAPQVTDHAVIRYLERVMGINIADVRDQVLGGSDKAWLETYNQVGDGQYDVAGHRLRVVNDKVVTVLD